MGVGGKLWPNNPTLIPFGLRHYCFIRSQAPPERVEATLSFWSLEEIREDLRLRCRVVLAFIQRSIYVARLDVTSDVSPSFALSHSHAHAHKQRDDNALL